MHVQDKNRESKTEVHDDKQQITRFSTHSTSKISVFSLRLTTTTITSGKRIP